MIRLSDEQGRMLRESLPPILEGISPRSGQQFQDIVNAIAEQLDAPHHFDDLVDIIVKMVQDPRLSALNRDHLLILRKAILSPLELARFNTIVGKGQDCVGCGRTLANHEAVTVVSKQLYCYRCAHPEVVTCQACHGEVDATGIRKTVERALQRHTCTVHPPEELSEVAASMPSVGIAGGLLEYRSAPTPSRFIAATEPASRRMASDQAIREAESRWTTRLMQEIVPQSPFEEDGNG